MATKRTVAKEVTEEGRSFEFRGVTFTLPDREAWPLDALEAMEDVKIFAFLKAALGAAGYADMKSVCKTQADFTEFLKALGEGFGVDPKDLEASMKSSKTK